MDRCSWPLVDFEEGDNPSYPEDHKMGVDSLCHSFLRGCFHGLCLERADEALHFRREELFQYGLVKTYLNSPLARFVSLLVGEGCQTSCSINSL